MRRIVLVVSLVVAVLAPGSGHASADVTKTAPFAAKNSYTQCQWIAGHYNVGSCTMSAVAREEDGSLAVDARIDSPDSAAGPRSLPTWGQAVANASMTSGFTLETDAQKIDFTFTLRIDEVTTAGSLPPELVWQNPTAWATVKQINCGCWATGVTQKISAAENGTDLTLTITLGGDPDPTHPWWNQSFRLPAGIWILQTGFQAQSGLILSAGTSHTTVRGSVLKMTAVSVDAPPQEEPPPER